MEVIFAWFIASFFGSFQWLEFAMVQNDWTPKMYLPILDMSKLCGVFLVLFFDPARNNPPRICHVAKKFSDQLIHSGSLVNCQVYSWGSGNYGRLGLGSSAVTNSGKMANGDVGEHSNCQSRSFFSHRRFKDSLKPQLVSGVLNGQTLRV